VPVTVGLNHTVGTPTQRSVGSCTVDLKGAGARRISALAEGKPHVPFRDSKLTRMLQQVTRPPAPSCL